MSIQYAGGTNVNTTLTQSAGTRAELAQWIRDQLIVAGWSSSGSATDYQLTSAATPAGLQARCRVYDPGSGSCAKLRFSNAGGTVTQAGDIFLLPAAAKVWRIVANKYQFFVFTNGSTARGFACGGVPHVFSGFGTTEAIWGVGNSRNDTDTTIRNSWRKTLQTGHSSSDLGNWVGIYNGTLTEENSNANAGPGCIQLYGVGPTQWQNNASPMYRHKDDTVIVGDALIGWGSVYTAEAKVVGQLWDAHLYAGSMSPDLYRTFDSKQWISITDSNSGTTAQYGPGTLMIYAP